jgi:hypothetical protein
MPSSSTASTGPLGVRSSGATRPLLHRCPPAPLASSMSRAGSVDHEKTHNIRTKARIAWPRVVPSPPRCPQATCDAARWRDLVRIVADRHAGVAGRVRGALLALSRTMLGRGVADKAHRHSIDEGSRGGVGGAMRAGDRAALLPLDWRGASCYEPFRTATSGRHQPASSRHPQHHRQGAALHDPALL